MLPFFIASFFNAFFNPFFHDIQIKGMVVDERAQSAIGATIVVYKASDSSIIKYDITNSEGKYDISFKECHDFFIKVTMVGYAPQYSERINCSKEITELPTMQLQSNQQLKTITVAAEKPMVTSLLDKTVINVENSILSTTTSAMEVLSKSPGIAILQNDQISFKGKSGVRILVNGKPLPMSNADLSNYLKSLPTSSIEKIELISNPSSKYDAAGSSGIIDIKLKKNTKMGNNGNINLLYGQGVYPKSGVGLYFNHKNKYFNFSSGYSLNYKKDMNDLRIYRSFYDNSGKKTLAYNQLNFLELPATVHNGRFSIEVNYNPNTNIGMSMNALNTTLKPFGDNLSDVQNGDGTVQSKFKTHQDSKDVAPNIVTNFYINHQWDSSKSSISVDADYMNFRRNSIQDYTTQYFDLMNNEYKPRYILHGDVLGNLSIKAIKVDYSTSLFNQRINLNTGAKFSDVIADNDLVYYDRSDSTNPVFDQNNSNHFIYRERIAAMYAEANFELKKLMVKLGLRGESTYVNGTQLITSEKLSKQYFNLFPSAFFTYTFSDKYAMGLNMSRRLDRPTYEDLNPFKFILDPTTYKTGNPNLNPQYTTEIEWNHNFFNKYILSLTYGYTTQPIVEVVAPLENADKLTVQTNKNLDNTQNFVMTFSVPFEPIKKWNSQFNFNTWYIQYKGTTSNTTINNGNLVVQLNSNNSFKINNKWSCDVNMNYLSPQIYAYMDFKTMWGIDLGIQHKFDQNRGTIKLSANDIFWTNRPVASNTYTNYDETFNIYRDTRTISLFLSYRFGNTKIEQIRKREGSGEEEKKRASKQG